MYANSIFATSLYIPKCEGKIREEVCAPLAKAAATSSADEVSPAI